MSLHIDCLSVITSDVSRVLEQSIAEKEFCEPAGWPFEVVLLLVASAHTPRISALAAKFILVGAHYFLSPAIVDIRR